MPNEPLHIEDLGGTRDECVSSYSGFTASRGAGLVAAETTVRALLTDSSRLDAGRA